MTVLTYRLISPVKCLLIADGRWRVYAPCGDDGKTFIERMSDDDEDQRHKLVALLDKAAKHGPHSIPADRNHAVGFTGKIRQFRVDHLRLLWFFDEGQVIVCARIYTKKKQKAPPGEVRAAEEFRQAYLLAKRDRRLQFIKP